MASYSDGLGLSRSSLVRIARVCLAFAATALFMRPVSAGIFLTSYSPQLVDNSYRSISDSTPARIAFYNYCPYAINFYWIDYSGNRQAWGYLNSGDNGMIDTFLTHPWLIVQQGTGDTTAQGTGYLVEAYLAATPVMNAQDHDTAEICHELKPWTELTVPNYSVLSVVVGQSGGPIKFRLTHGGNEHIAIYIQSIASDNPQEFPISSSTCGTALMSGSCDADVTFTPSATGTRSARISVTTSDFGTRTVLIQGIGIAPTSPPPTATPVAQSVEYFHASFGHYFITSLPSEIAALDAGQFGGWTRTGQSFGVWAAPGTGLSPVCRFFSTAFGEKSSHFYTPYPAECATVSADAHWQYEGIVAYAALPSASGTCSAGVPLYRLYNNGQGGAPNHRYTTSTTTQSSMIAQGWIPEGAGSAGVFACIHDAGSTTPPGGSQPNRCDVAAFKEWDRAHCAATGRIWVDGGNSYRCYDPNSVNEFACGLNAQGCWNCSVSP